MTIDPSTPTAHANAYDAGQAAGRRDKAAGRHSNDLALESWLYQNPSNAEYSDSFRSGYTAGHS